MARRFLDITRFAFAARVEELRPAVAEFKRGERVLQAVDELNAAQSTPGGRPVRKYLPPPVRWAQVLDLVAAGPEKYRRTDIAVALDLTKTRAGQIVQSLLADGLIEERGGGRLAITQKAERMLEGRHPEESPV